MWLTSSKLFDVTISDLSNNKSYPTFSCEYHTHVQHYLSTFRTLHSLMIVAYKKNFFVLQQSCRTILICQKNFFVDIIFFKKFFITYFSVVEIYTSISLLEGIFQYIFPYRIYMLFQIYFEINYILQNNFLWHLISCMFWWH